MESPLRSGISPTIYAARKDFCVLEVFLQRKLDTLAKMKDFYGIRIFVICQVDGESSPWEEK